MKRSYHTFFTADYTNRETTSTNMHLYKIEDADVEHEVKVSESNKDEKQPVAFVGSNNPYQLIKIQPNVSNIYEQNNYCNNYSNDGNNNTIQLIKYCNNRCTIYFKD